MEKYNIVREKFEKTYKDYLQKLQDYDLEYERGRQYVQDHKRSYKELTEKATFCCQARIQANIDWEICCSHPLHKFFKGYSQPETCKYGIK